jgi:hypothetical protein
MAASSPAPASPAPQFASHVDTPLQLEEQARAWVEAIIGRALVGDTLHEGLKDGTALCALANAIKPDSIKKFTLAPKSGIQRSENISLYLKATRALGMKEYEMFSSIDLAEEKNLKAVTTNLHALGRLLQSPPFAALALPKLGIKAAEANKRVFTEAQLREATAAVSLLNLGSGEMGQKAGAGVLSGKGFDASGAHGGGGGGGEVAAEAAVAPAEAPASEAPAAPAP